MGIFARLRSAIQPPASLLYGVYSALSDPPVEGDIRPMALGSGGGMKVEMAGSPAALGPATPALSMSTTAAQSASITWQVPVTTAATSLLPAWVASTTYTLGRMVTNGGNLYRCRTAGAAAGSGGPTGTSADITDGAAHWRYVAASAGFKGGAILRCLSDSDGAMFVGDLYVLVSSGHEIPASQAEVDQSPDLSLVFVVGGSTATATVRAFL